MERKSEKEGLVRSLVSSSKLAGELSGVQMGEGG
jgi:hypothetical protein